MKVELDIHILYYLAGRCYRYSLGGKKDTKRSWIFHFEDDVITKSPVMDTQETLMNPKKGIGQVFRLERLI